MFVNRLLPFRLLVCYRCIIRIRPCLLIDCYHLDCWCIIRCIIRRIIRIRPCLLIDCYHLDCWCIIRIRPCLLIDCYHLDCWCIIRCIIRIRPCLLIGFGPNLLMYSLVEGFVLLGFWSCLLIDY